MLFLAPALPALSVLFEAAILGAATTVGARLANDAYDALKTTDAGSASVADDAQS